jgi:hypothetical protein
MVTQLNVSGVFALFETAIAHSLKYPKIRLQTSNGQNVVLSRAGDKSRYTGQIQVTDGRPYGANVYFGRIDTAGIFHVSTADASVSALLARLSENPADVASEYGRLTGQCCFCGLALKDARSTAVGYGPICADKFGLAWGTGKLPKNNVHSISQANEVSPLGLTVRSEFEMPQSKRIVTYFYRGSMNVNLVVGNGRQTEAQN